MKLLLKYLGYILIISGIFRIIPISSALFYGDSYTLYVVSLLISVVLGLLLIAISNKISQPQNNLTINDSILLVAITFIVVILIGTISYLPSVEYKFTDALFESTSGYTTTGLTIFDSVESLPKSLILWRSLTQWIGGIGIIMVFLVLFSHMRGHRLDSNADQVQKKSTKTLYNASGFTEQSDFSTKDMTKRVFLIYCGYTVLGIILLSLLGLPLLQATTVSFAAISTGGFSSVDNFYNDPLILVVIILMMLIGASSFIVHNNLLRGKIKDFLFSEERNMLLLFIVLAYLLTFMFVDNPLLLIFNLVSAFTTTGFAASPIAILAPVVILMIFIGMTVGGSVASTSGGLKVFRILTMLKLIPWTIKKMSAPAAAIIPFTICKKTFSDDKIILVQSFILTYATLLVLGIVSFMMLGFSFFDSSFQIFSALGTVGLQSMSMSAIPIIGKLILMLFMLLGRLEIFPIFILVNSFFKK